MDEDMLKTWGSDDSSMDMMMQMEKFPELYEPFYNNNNNTLNLTNAEKQFSCVSGSSTMPSVNSTVTPLTPNFVNSSQISFSNFVNNPMTPSIQPNEVPSGRLTLNGSFSYPSSSEKKSSMAAMREMIFRIAVMQPIHIDPESVKAPKRRNVKISKDPQSVAARHRRERISERIRILQRLVPGGMKMDTAAMLDEAVHYVKFLKKQVQTLEQVGVGTRPGFNVVGFPGVLSNTNVTNYSASNLLRGCQPCKIVGPPSKQMLS